MVRLLGLIKSLDYYRLLLQFHMSTLHPGRGDLEPVKLGYTALGLRNKGIEAMFFLLGPPSGDVGLEKKWMDPGGQQLLAQLMLMTGIWFLPWRPSLRIKDCSAETEST